MGRPASKSDSSDTPPRNGGTSNSRTPMHTQQPGIPPRMPYRGGREIMPAPALIPGVPPGLEYLTLVDGIIVHQLFEPLEIMLGFETRNRYALLNTAGQQVYFAFEESSLAERMCLGQTRPFTMHITDNFQRPIMIVRRPYECCIGSNLCGYTGCVEDQVLVECPPGKEIGRVVQLGACCHLEFMVQDVSGKQQFIMHGPTCACVCEDQDYQIMDARSMAPIGAITKMYGGMMREMFTKADTFSVKCSQLDFFATKVVLLKEGEFNDVNNDTLPGPTDVQVFAAKKNGNETIQKK